MTPHNCCHCGKPTLNEVRVCYEFVCDDCMAKHIRECLPCFHDEQRWAADDIACDVGRGT